MRQTQGSCVWPFIRWGALFGWEEHHRRSLGDAQGPASCLCVTSGTKSRTSEQVWRGIWSISSAPEAQVPGALPGETASVGPGNCTWFLLQSGLEARGCIWWGLFGSSGRGWVCGWLMFWLGSRLAALNLQPLFCRSMPSQQGP